MQDFRISQPCWCGFRSHWMWCHCSASGSWSFESTCSFKPLGTIHPI